MNNQKQNILREKLKQALVSTARVISNDFRDKNDDNKNLKNTRYFKFRKYQF